MTWTCPRCSSEKIYAIGDDPAPYVRCMDCQFMFIEQKGPTSHETLKQINDRLERIEKAIEKMLSSKT